MSLEGRPGPPDEVRFRPPALLRRLAQVTEMYGYPRGRVKISAYSPDGKEQILALLGPGDLFGELTPVGPRGAVRVEAFAQSIVCSLHRTLFEDVIKIGPVPARPAVAQPIFRTALIR